MGNLKHKFFQYEEFINITGVKTKLYLFDFYFHKLLFDIPL